jgi:hypothetical protein
MLVPSTLGTRTGQTWIQGLHDRGVAANKRRDAIHKLMSNGVYMMRLAEFSLVSAHRLKMCAKGLNQVLDAVVFQKVAQSCKAPDLARYLTQTHAPDVESICAILYRDGPNELDAEIKGRWSRQLVQMLVAWKVAVPEGSDQMVDAISKGQFRRFQHLLLLCPDAVTDVVLKEAVSAMMRGRPHAATVYEKISEIHPLEKISEGRLLDMLRVKHSECRSTTGAMRVAFDAMNAFPHSTAVAMAICDVSRTMPFVTDSAMKVVETIAQILKAFPLSERIQESGMLTYYTWSYNHEWIVPLMTSPGVRNSINHALVTFTSSKVLHHHGSTCLTRLDALLQQ